MLLLLWLKMIFIGEATVVIVIKDDARVGWRDNVTLGRGGGGRGEFVLKRLCVEKVASGAVRTNARCVESPAQFSLVLWMTIQVAKLGATWEGGCFCSYTVFIYYGQSVILCFARRHLVTLIMVNNRVRR